MYRPVAGHAPLTVYLHGGGWTIGSLETHDRVCRRLADGSGAAVLAIDYRLAPENPWPASVDDTVSALRWVASGPPELGEAPDAVAVAGDSAGGTLAALACLRLREEDPAALPDLQVLLYANADLTGAQPSMREKAIGWGLDAEKAWRQAQVDDQKETAQAAEFLSHLGSDEIKRRVDEAEQAYDPSDEGPESQECPVCGNNTLVADASDEFGYGTTAGTCLVCSYLRSEDIAYDLNLDQEWKTRWQ